MTMKYSRAGGMPAREAEKIRDRLAGNIAGRANASGAVQQEAHSVFPSSEPSPELKGEGMELSPEVLAAAEHNRKNREAVRQLEAETDAVEAQQEDPINGIIDPLDLPPAAEPNPDSEPPIAMPPGEPDALLK